MHITCSTTLLTAIIPISIGLLLGITKRTLYSSDICLGSLTAKKVEFKQFSDSSYIIIEAAVSLANV